MGPMNVAWEDAEKAISRTWAGVRLSMSGSLFTPEMAWQKLADTKQFELL